ncbi:MAG: type VI secretion system tip protein TssI/VgrG [Polyangiaceae bacterium]
MPSDRFLFEVEGVSSSLRVVRFSAREALSELFQLEVLIASDDPALDFDAFADKRALLTMQGDEPRYIHGHVSRLRLGDAGKKLTTYAVSVVPMTWKLQHRHDCRIFQNLSVPDILTKVLEGAGCEAGTHFRLAVQGTYAAREYCVQYRESDFAFISRLMEEVGIYYFFEHTDSGHVMVLADGKAPHVPIAGEASVRYVPPAGAVESGEHIHRFHYTQDIRTGKVTLRDYDFVKPRLKFEGVSEGATHTDLEIYDFPANVPAPADAKARAALRVEERTSLSAAGEGESAVTRLVPGSLFTITEHPREALNREMLVTRVEHRGVEPIMGEAGTGGGTRYSNRFECIPTDVPFRAPLLTPRPTIKGVQSARVVGPSGEEIHVDKHGRVKVLFHWDRLGKEDDTASCWMRVSQGWAGGGFDAMHIPRVGQEVLVDFLEGDPDLPIIVGRVYNGVLAPPYALPANKTISTMRTSSSPGGDGFNELRFEDKAGSEHVFLHAQKDWNIEVLNDKTQVVGHDETREVKNNRTLKVGVDQVEEIGQNETLLVKKDRTKTVENDEIEKINHDRTIEVGNDHTESILNNMTLSVTSNQTVDIGADAAETVGGNKSTTVSGNATISISGDLAATVSGAGAADVSGAMEVTAKSLKITCGSTIIDVKDNGDISITSGNNVSIDASGKIDVKSSGNTKIEASGKVDIKSSGATEVNASGKVKVKGSSVGIN